MSEIPVKVKIGERLYPMRVAATDEEHVRKAAKMINDRITKHLNTYPTADRQDVLAMCAVELGAELLRNKQQHTAAEDETRQSLSELSSLLS